jgi:hypothetical protein
LVCDISLSKRFRKKTKQNKKLLLLSLLFSLQKNCFFSPKDLENKKKKKKNREANSR